MTELQKLREHEANLESQIAKEKAERDRLTDNITRMANRLSQCKKHIAEHTIGKGQITAC